MTDHVPGEPLLSTLQELGLNRQEAVVYSTLVSLGPSPARDVSQASNLAREHCYEVLRKLEAKGLVKVVLSDRSVFVPVEPRAAISLLLSNLDSRFAALRDAAYEAGASLEALRSRVPHPPQGNSHHAPQIQLVFGERVFLEFEKELEACKDEYMGVISPQTLVTPRGLRTLQSIERAARRGIRVRVLTGIPPEGGTQIAHISSVLKIRVNAMAADGLRFGLFDRSRLIQPLHVPVPAEEEREAIFTGNPTLVNGLVTYFEHLWRNSTPLSGAIRTPRRRVRK